MATNLRDVERSLKDLFVAAGITADDVPREIQMIAQFVTGWSTAEQHLHAEEPLEYDQLEQFQDIAQQRSRRIPLQYVLEEAWFMGLRLNVRSGVLIPRPDTETLVETALKMLDGVREPWVLDVGTGSGAIAIAIAHARKDVRVMALDISKAALDIANENARLHNVSDRIHFVKADWLATEPSKKFDAVISNPPYIPVSALPTLQPEVAMHEPEEALFGSDVDGLGFYRNLANSGAAHLGEGGFIAVEVGHDQGARVLEIFATNHWLNVQTVRDLNGISRVVTASRA